MTGNRHGLGALTTGAAWTWQCRWKGWLATSATWVVIALPLDCALARQFGPLPLCDAERRHTIFFADGATAASAVKDASSSTCNGALCRDATTVIAEIVVTHFNGLGSQSGRAHVTRMLKGDLTQFGGRLARLEDGSLDAEINIERAHRGCLQEDDFVVGRSGVVAGQLDQYDKKGAFTLSAVTGTLREHGLTPQPDVDPEDLANEPLPPAMFEQRKKMWLDSLKLEIRQDELRFETRARSFHGGVVPLAELARLHRNQKRYQEALEYYRRAIDIATQDIVHRNRFTDNELFYGLARTYHDLGDDKNALLTYRRITTSSRNSIELALRVHRGMASSLEATGDHVAAENARDFARDARDGKSTPLCRSAFPDRAGSCRDAGLGEVLMMKWRDFWR